MIKASIQKVYWSDVRQAIAKVNPGLAKVLDELQPGEDLPLYRACYPYGSTVIDSGLFHVPLPDGSVAPIDDPRVDEDVRRDLLTEERGIPMGIVLGREMELLVKTKHHELTWRVFSPGYIFALWKKLDIQPSHHPVNLFKLTAGVRSLFMLPNISDVKCHRHLRRDFNLKLPVPSNLMEQWHIFKALLQHPSIDCQWHNDVLFFSKLWLEKIGHCAQFKDLYSYLLTHAWRNTSYERNQVLYYFALSVVQENRNLRPNPYLTDTVRHIFTICNGMLPGFCVANDDSAAPVSILQDIYIHSYGLKQYIPTFMRSRFIQEINNDEYMYYSLQLPTTLQFAPSSRKESSRLLDLNEIKHIMNTFIHEVTYGKLSLENTSMWKTLMSMEYDYFHNRRDYHQEIRLTKELAQEDPLLQQHKTKWGERILCDSSVFFRGCIRMKKNLPKAPTNEIPPNDS